MRAISGFLALAAMALASPAAAAENRCGILTNPTPANCYYGHRCACLGVDTDRRSMRILSIHSARALPMKRCDADPALRKRR